MKRRRFLSMTGAVVGLAAGGVLYRRATVDTLSMAALVRDLRALRETTLDATGAWSPFKVFAHLAQSVDYSITGYPVMKPPVFRQTAGRAAYVAFSTAGAMRHSLEAPIPGAPALPDNGPTTEAIDNLLAALERFEAHTGALQPHFAYGTLTRDDYRIAHVLHVRNHLLEILTA